MARFLESCCIYSGLYEYRGTRLIGAANLSPVTKLVASTGAVSRYRLTTEPGICHDTQRLRVCTGAVSGWCDVRVMK